MESEQKCKKMLYIFHAGVAGRSLLSRSIESEGMPHRTGINTKVRFCGYGSKLMGMAIPCQVCCGLVKMHTESVECV